MKHLITFLFLSLSIGSFAQAKFYAQADAKEMLSNSYLTVSFIIENAQASDFKAPAFKDFTVLQGPSQSNRTSIINGRRSSTLSFTYILQPKRIGNLSIEAASATIGGAIQKTKNLYVKVLKDSAKNKNQKKFFIEAVVSDTSTYLGQQILIDYVLFARVDQNINSISIQREDDFEGFFALAIKDFNENVQRKIINGTEYAFQTVRKIALFPQKVGQFTIDPSSFILYVASDNPNQTGRMSSFFGSFKEEFCSTESFNLTVNNIPNKTDFSGTVGNYSLLIQSNKNTISLDQSISLILTLYGDGDPELIKPPSLNLTDSLEVYDPNFIKEDKYVDQGRQKHKTIYEYLIVPKHVGDYRIQPSINYFNPDSNTFETAVSNVINLKVLKGAGKSNLIEDTNLSERSDKMYPFIEEVKLSSTKWTFYNSVPFWIIFGLILSGFPLITWMRHKKIQEGLIDPELIKSQNARRVAESKLAFANEYKIQNDQRSFFNEISKSILGYASDKIKIPASEMSKENISSTLLELGVSKNLVEKISDILKSCELSLFAGSNESGKMDEVYYSTLETLSLIEEQLS